MTHLIQPCCVQKHLLAVRNAIGDNGTTQFHAHGDVSLAELLPAMLTRYAETEMMIVAPSLPDQAAETIDRCMRKKRARMDGRGNMDVIRHLTLVAPLDRENSDYICKWLKEQPFGDRLTLVDTEQVDTAILLPDFAITGPVNMRYNKHFVAEATTEPEKVRALWEKYRRLAEDTVKRPTEAESKPRPKGSQRKKKGAG